jgi:outer membrane protein OmpA-like peptidoglycan-associated protein
MEIKMKKFLVSALLVALCMATGCSSAPSNGAASNGQVSAQQEKKSIFFDFGKKDVKAEYYGVLADTASYLKKHKHAMLTIQGNTDDIGSDSYNQVLGLKRAESIKHYLVKMGVKKSQITVVSNGAKDPIASNKDKAGRMKNRRGDITIQVCSLPKGFKSGDQLPAAK